MSTGERPSTECVEGALLAESQPLNPLELSVCAGEAPERPLAAAFV